MKIKNVSTKLVTIRPQEREILLSKRSLTLTPGTEVVLYDEVVESNVSLKKFIDDGIISITGVEQPAHAPSEAVQSALDALTARVAALEALT